MKFQKITEVAQLLGLSEHIHEGTTRDAFERVFQAMDANGDRAQPGPDSHVTVTVQQSELLINLDKGIPDALRQRVLSCYGHGQLGKALGQGVQHAQGALI